MSQGSPDNILEWFKNIYLPLRLLERNAKYVEKDPKDEKSTSKLNLWFKITSGSSVQYEQLERNTCLFLNELTGYGHLYADAAKE